MAAAVGTIDGPWQTACRLHTTLFNGYALEPVCPRSTDLTPEVGEQVIGVFRPQPGEPLDYARWMTQDVVVTHRGPGLVIGSPQFVAGYAIGSLVTAGRTRRKARRLAQPQWWTWALTCAVVTNHRLWCDVAGQRRHFAYSQVTNVQLNDTTLMLEFTSNVEPLCLAGPWAPWIAVAIAHHRFGREATARLPWLALMPHVSTA